MQSRLNHLESLVKGAMASQPSDNIDARAKSQSHVSGRVVDATYVGATHWAAILDDVGLNSYMLLRFPLTLFRLKK